ncbi:MULTISPECIES: flagellar filament capping protein FliD [Cupriavidus]|uniref:Flagellar hook-associated protein 2 n=1 Tax=Cupriavidus pauculus TaxID=82633 RepID=A0A3G8H7P9_9BURK|nr:MULTISPECIES: flagellar filament capping protein FliD [Cupriavidus]AZG16398.1 flagellar hook protein [Cupriavidus pauculus]MDT6963207.1 flagellar filament capping protein FliD [Cupriavidus sp. SZY C1]
MAAISNIGVGSNLQLGDLLDKLEASENTRLDAINTQAKSYQAKLSGYGTVKSVLDAYAAAAKTLANAQTYSAVTAKVGSDSVLTATNDATAVSGKYTVNVTSLAAAQSVVSKQVADQKAAIGGGTITFDFGENLGSGGTPTSTKTVTIGSDTSLQGIRDSINKAGIGVTASIINDGSGTPYRLVLTSDQTGTKSGFKVSASDSAVGDVVAFDPTLATQPNGMSEKVKAANAALTINNIAVTSQSNTISEAAQGVTLNLKSLGTTSLDMTVDTASIKTAVAGFVAAYNNVLTAAKTLTAFDTDAGTKGALNGDGTLRNIQARMRAMLNTPMSDGNGKTITLSDIGVEFSLDSSNNGTLKVNDDKLSKTITNNMDKLKAVFAGVNGAAGIGKTVTDYNDSLNATGGALSAATDGITSTLKDLEDKYTFTQDQITATMDRYRKQFTQLDLLVAQMNQTSSYLTQQFSALNGSSTKK